MQELTPKQIVNELDKYIIGQEKAKKIVAVALRSRYRRNLLDLEMKEEITPKNILMIGPTGVGKTEIARRLAKLVNAPFIKVEATKFTEVGYVGRDVESIIRDLVEISIRMVKTEKIEEVNDKAYENAINVITGILIPSRKSTTANNPFEMLFNYQTKEVEKETQEDDDIEHKRRVVGQKLREGEFDNEIIEIEIEDSTAPTVEMLSGVGIEQMNINFQDIFGGIFPKKIKKRKLIVKEALKILIAQEAQKLIDMDSIIEEGKKKAEQRGIIFLDEIDKIAGRGYSSGPDVSREGVQRDILPIVEGSTVNTKYGAVKTDYMLFIAAGAFHISKVSDLIPELQGRFPVRVELESLNRDNFKAILTKPNNALIKQYKALFLTEGIDLKFEDEAIEEISDIAEYMNEHSENIGARRLYTVMENLLQELSYNASDIVEKGIVINREFVKNVLHDEIRDKDINKYII